MQDTIDTSSTELAQLRIQLQQAVPANSEVEAQMSSLRADLAQAQQDTEDLRTSASINVAVSSAPTDSGSKSVAEQVAEHVEAVRVELESRHNERVKQNDETLEKRTNMMKAQLSKKLTDGKAQVRQTLTVEHEQALQLIKADYEKEKSRLQARHKDEIEELRQSADSKYAKLRDQWDKAHQATNSSNGDANVKDETPRSTWQPSEDEARALIQSNEIVRSIVKKNIGIHVNKAKDELSTQLKQDHERAMTGRTMELQEKANTAKEHAVLMEGKKSAVQINVANNKARMLQYRVDIVQKAAQDTPLKPVAEVWLVAKDARPPPVTPQQPQQPQKSQQPQKPQQPQQSQQEPNKAQNLVQGSAQQGPINRQGQSSGVSVFGRPTSAAATANGRQSPGEPASTNSQGQLSGVTTFGRPTPAVGGFQAAAPSGLQSTAERPPQTQPESNNNERRPQPAAAISQSALNPPQRPAQGATHHHPNSGPGGGILRGLQHSGLPVARGNSVRGNPMSRGRGAGVGRGGPQGLDTSRSQGQQIGRGSPTSTGLNAGAKQFVPGNKRPRDDGQDGSEGGNGKKIRGGGGSA